MIKHCVKIKRERRLTVKITNEQNPRLPYLREKTSKLTLSPGCYLMKDKTGNIIYIGKAKSLKKRVTSYFRESADHLPKVAKMVQHVYDYDFIVTDSEYEALVLEASLIKQNQPHYNILLKDDKGYSYIKISDEEYPRITRELQKKGAGEYIGPFTSGFVSKQAVEEVNKVFALPTCTRKFPRDFKKQRPCLNYSIKQCMGVCRGDISSEDYQKIVMEAVEYIKNGSGISVERLTKEMNAAAEEMNFELAARLRDRINAIKGAAEKQKIFEKSVKDTDIIGVARSSSQACISVLMYRGGRLFDKSDFFLGENEDNSELREDFLSQYYQNKTDIPKEIYIDEPIENKELLERFLREKCGHAVSIISPQRGEMLKLTMLAKSNASEYLSIKVGRSGKEIAALDELAKVLGMQSPPKHIECYDISNLSSADMVAGMVVFENGRPQKKYYKKFSIKTVLGQNDYACMREVLKRRFNRYFESQNSQEETDEGFSKLPDLIFLDGGKGHVGAVEPMLREMGISVPVFGLVKDSKHRTRAIATNGGEISVSKTRAAFALITRIQDEVHRFSVSYQAQKHKKSGFALELTRVKGIGEKKAAKLIAAFKTKEALKSATVDEIAKEAGISFETAAELKEKVIDELIT